jgi:hypothetical protein
MVYRNYNAPPDKLLQESPWEVLSDNPSRLFNFMDTVRPEYGFNEFYEEAVEVGFARIVEEDSEVGRVTILNNKMNVTACLQLHQEHIDQVVLI